MQSPEDQFQLHRHQQHKQRSNQDYQMQLQKHGSVNIPIPHLRELNQV